MALWVALSNFDQTARYSRGILATSASTAALLNVSVPVRIQRRIGDRIDGRQIRPPNRVAALGKRADQERFGRGVTELAGAHGGADHLGRQRRQLLRRPELVVRRARAGTPGSAPAASRARD